MTRHLLPAMLVVLATATRAATLGELRHLHAETYRLGGLCRHAAAAVYDRATRDGMPAHVLWYTTRGGQYPRHALPLVYVHDAGAWHAIDSGRSPMDGQLVPRSRRLDTLERISDAGWAGNVGGALLREFIGYVPPEVLTDWRRELRKMREKGGRCGTSE